MSSSKGRVPVRPTLKRSAKEAHQSSEDDEGESGSKGRVPVRPTLKRAAKEAHQSSEDDEGESGKSSSEENEARKKRARHEPSEARHEPSQVEKLLSILINQNQATATHNKVWNATLNAFMARSEAPSSAQSSPQVRCTRYCFRIFLYINLLACW